MTYANPQVIASDPEVSAFVTANAGSGKTRTLVDRVARLLLRGARPEAIACITYTKAAAAEMQRRLFETLGGWAVTPDEALAAELARIDEKADDLPKARALFARALETPGGLKIQTIHAFCEKLLKRFPLEAGISPGFQVLEDQAAREVSARARESVAEAALQDPSGPIGAPYARLAVELDYRAFNDMFAAFEARRPAIQAYLSATDSVPADVWRSCGLDQPESADDIRAAAVAPPALDVALWQAGARVLSASGPRDQKCAEQMGEVAEAALAGGADFELAMSVFCTAKGEAAKWVDTAAALKSDPGLREALIEERERLLAASHRAKAAQVAEDTVAVLTLAQAYIAFYEGAKEASGGLDFADLIERTRELLSIRADAAWVLFKLDGGIDHLLVDEAQDTAPAQWDLIRPLTEEFFAGAGAAGRGRRTVFAVGDEKQSIYSFQGADPERFLNEAREYQSLVEGAGETFIAPDLLTSYRSAPEVLNFVDAVFEDPAALRALRPEGPGQDVIVRHIAHRDGGHGTVDLWTPEEGDPAPEMDVWAPVDAAGPSEGAGKRLARRIARDIKARVGAGEAVFDKDARTWRPMRWGDVLILVRRRNALFHEIIRALKSEGAPVGGADRLTLSEHIVFADLVGLARFCLYPWDDLTLAALLRSPLCDVPEEGPGGLFELAYGRGGSLWAELTGRAAEHPGWSAAKTLLDWARSEAETRAPFDLYARLMGRLDTEGRSMRARILTRLGREAEQALDAFLAETLAAERRGVRDLESFAAEMAASEVEVKREQEDGHGEVRVMTVHGAKGLEAPLVYLPDTTTKAGDRGGPLLDHQGGFLWCARKGEDCGVSAGSREARALAGENESLRLLYVAMTRARDRLVVCGVKPTRGYDGSWHDLIARAFTGSSITADVREIADDAGRTILRHGADPLNLRAEAAAALAPAATPEWMRRPAPAEAAARAFASPSRLAEADHGPAPSPLADVGGLGRFRRGDLIHHLLQLLPDLLPGERPAAAEKILGREDDLSPEQRAEMIAAAMTVLTDARFSEVFGPGSRPEVAIMGSAPGLPSPVSARLDRLLITPEKVLVIDYKTNRPSPGRIENASGAYVTQMAAYVAVLRAIYPGRPVEAALVWTDGPKLMPVPEKLMAEALKALSP